MCGQVGSRVRPVPASLHVPPIRSTGCLSRHQNKLWVNLENNEVARVIPQLSLSNKQNQLMGLLADVQPLLIGEVTNVLEWGCEVCTWLLPLV